MTVKEVKITAPVEGYTGLSACVSFADGHATAKVSDAQLAYFKEAGYEVEVLRTLTDKELEAEAEAEKAKTGAKTTPSSEKSDTKK
jgi:hypothetical protein